MELDKKNLEEKFADLNQQIIRLNYTDKGKKHIKPFISTVKQNASFPDISTDKDKPCGCKSAMAASSSSLGNKKIHKELEKLKIDLKYSQDLIEVLRKQEGEKDREIQRLTCLFVGGRPVNALVKDCCYKDVSKLTDDINHLQHQKIELTTKLNDYEDRNEKLYQKWKQQKEKIKQMEAYLKEISDAALYVEREANLRIKNQNRDIVELKENLNKNIDETRLNEIKELKKNLKEKNKQEQKHLFEIEYLKNKLNELERTCSSKNSDLVAELVRERDILQNKLKILGSGSECTKEISCNLNQHYCNMREKEAEITRLREEICSLKTAVPSNQGAALTVTNTLRRTECERDCAVNKVQSLKIEIESLQDKIKIMQDSKLADNKKIIQLEENLSKLKLEIQDLHSSKTPAFATIKQLREENCDLQIKLRSAEEDYQKLNCTYNQIKMLSQQTENVLMNVQNQLEFTKCELSEREAQICCVNKSNECLKDQIEKLTSDISKLKSEKCTVEREKEFYMMTLDKKNEKLQTAESKAETVRCLKTANQKMKTQIDDLNCEMKRMESILCDTRSENQCLCKQLETTKHHLTNAIHENGRMADELATITAELNSTKKCLADSQKESENIRSKLQSYIKEIEQVNGLIALKDSDRKQALGQYKDLECQFKSLDEESNESKRIISEYQQRIKILSDTIHGKEVDIETLEKQLIDLSTEIELIRSENLRLFVELDAQKNLCDKLDLASEKQKAEILEYKMSVKELLEKNDKLHEQIMILREGGGGDTHVSASYHPTM